MQASLVYSNALNAYNLGSEHALRPERVDGAVAMMRAHDLLGADGLHLTPPAEKTSSASTARSTSTR